MALTVASVALLGADVVAFNGADEGGDWLMGANSEGIEDWGASPSYSASFAAEGETLYLDFSSVVLQAM